MTRYVIGPDVAIRLAHDQAVIRGGHQIPAPALLRSQVLSLLYQAVRRGEMTRKDAERQLEYVRGLRIRLRRLPGDLKKRLPADIGLTGIADPSVLAASDKTLPETTS